MICGCVYVRKREEKRTGGGHERVKDGGVHGELANTGEKLDDLHPQVRVVEAVFQSTTTAVSGDVSHLSTGGGQKYRAPIVRSGTTKAVAGRSN